jgi:hypothetical protein
MDRREAVKGVALLLGGTLSATTMGALFNSCASPSAKKNGALFTAEQEQMITEIADIIIPDTKTPGAKAAGVGPFIVMTLKDCYPEDAQNAFVKGLDDLEELSKKEFDNSFLKISVKEREQLLGKLRDETVGLQKADKEKDTQNQMNSQKQTPDKPLAAPPKYPATTPYFFAIVRDLTLLGYFTSEIGATQALEYVYIPGRYDGCVDMKPGQRVYS